MVTHHSPLARWKGVGSFSVLKVSFLASPWAVEEGITARYRRRCRLNKKPANREADRPASNPSRSLALPDNWEGEETGEDYPQGLHWIRSQPSPVALLPPPATHSPGNLARRTSGTAPCSKSRLSPTVQHPRGTCKHCQYSF